MASIITFLVVWFLISIPVTFFIGAVFSLSKKGHKVKEVSPSRQFFLSTT